MPVTHGGGVKKEWKSWEDQVALLKGRHLALDEGEALGLLRTASYYRLSGYARYFQQGAELGGNDFVAGSTLADIKMIHELDGRLRTMLASRLGRVEVMLRSQYAYAVGATKGPYGDYLDDAYFGGGGAGADVVDACLRDLDRSKEPFVRHFCREGDDDRYGDMPVWAAAEVLSFGTLSKCLERADRGGILSKLNEETGVAKAGLETRIRSFAYLRNRCAHHARLWNHSVIDAGATPNNVRKKTKRRFGNFDGRSVMDVLASLADVLERCGLEDDFLGTVSREFSDHPLFWDGLLWPCAAEDRSKKGHPFPESS